MLNNLLKKMFWGAFRHFLSDRQYAKVRYWIEMGRIPDLENPKSLTEKIQYLKLNERTEIRKKAADRIAVRDYVREKTGEEHLIPLLGNFEELTQQSWDSLPSSFVLKANHGCKMVKIVKDKSEEIFSEIQQLTQSWQETDYYKLGREWVYKDVPRTIVAEELLQDKDGSIPRDYKFYCFHGKVEFMQIDFDRFGEQTRNLYDRNFNFLPIRFSHSQNNQSVNQHPLFEQAVELSETLAEEFNFIRVDLYLLHDTVYFGELTNFPANGFIPFEPHSANLELGQKLKL